MKFSTLFLLLISFQSFSQSVETHLKMAAKMEDNKDFEGAIIQYTNALRINPKLSEVYVNRGTAKAFIQNDVEAIADFTSAINMGSKNFNAFYNRGLLLAKMSKFSEALLDFEKAINIDPKSFTAHMNRGTVKSRLQDHKSAIYDFTMAIEIRPNEPMPYYSRGYSKNLLHDKLGAIADYTKAIELRPNWIANVYYNRGLVEIDLERKKEACEDFSEASRLGLDAGALASLKFCGK